MEEEKNEFYNVDSGIMCLMPNGKYELFANYEAYEDAIKEKEYMELEWK